jgi:hypothetical protein
MDYFKIAEIMLPLLIAIIGVFVRMEVNIAVQKEKARNIALNLEHHITTTNETLNQINIKLDNLINKCIKIGD